MFSCRSGDAKGGDVWLPKNRRILSGARFAFEQAIVSDVPRFRAGFMTPQQHRTPSGRSISNEAVQVPIGRESLQGDLASPSGASGIVVFAHGSGSSRHSPRNRLVADVLQQRGFATVLIDLLTEKEEVIDQRSARLRFDIPMLADRLLAIVAWLKRQPRLCALPVGLFGASTGGGAALVAAAKDPDDIAAVVSRGGRPDLAGLALPRVIAPTLLIVGERDDAVIAMNRDAIARLRTDVALKVVPGATHLFQEAGTLEQVAALAADWFEAHLCPTPKALQTQRSA